VHHVRQKALRFLHQAGLACIEEGNSCLTVPDICPDMLLDQLPGPFTAMELRETLALLLPGPARMPDLDDFGQAMPLSRLLARHSGRWLAQLLSDRRLTTLFQPILAARGGLRVAGHECLMRGIDRDGAMIGPGRLLDVARGADMLFPLDRLARETAVERLAASGAGGLVFINFTPTSIYDPRTCLRTTLDAVRRTGLDRGRIVFEVTESERIDDPEHLVNVLAFYRDAGFKVALDDLGAGYASLDLLATLRPDFVKIDMHLVQGVATDSYRAAIVSRLLDLARELHIQTIAEGVEEAADRDWLIGHGADHLQGYLFGRPDPRPLAVAA